MNCKIIVICAIAICLAGPSSAKPSPLLDLSELTGVLPLADEGKTVGGLTSAVPILGGSTGGLLKVRSPAIDPENSSLEPRGMFPGLPNMSGMTSMIPGMGQSSGGLPGMGGLTSMMPGMGGSNGGFLKVRRSTGPASPHSKRLSLLGLDSSLGASQAGASKKAPASQTGASKKARASQTGASKKAPGSQTGASKKAPSTSHKSTGELLPTSELPSPLSGLTL